MSKQANKKAIGAFVLAGLVLAVAAIVIFGSGKFFVKQDQYVAYFQGSVKGLRVGAPVVFRGVKIGEVTKMMLYADPRDGSFDIPVTLEIEQDNFHIIGPEIKDRKQFVQGLIKIGLRAQLQMQSIVTGQLMINFDLHPDTPVRLVGGQKIDLAKGVTEIPTIQTAAQKLEKTLEDIHIGEIVKSVKSSLKGIESIVTSEELTKSLHYFKQTMKDIRDLVLHVDVKIDPLLGSATAAIGHADELVLSVNKQIDPLAAAVKKTADAVTGAADAARPAEKEVARAFANITALTGKGSEERRQLDRTLKALQEAARSIKIWADYLERHPEALIRGKGKSKRR